MRLGGVAHQQGIGRAPCLLKRGGHDQRDCSCSGTRRSCRISSSPPSSTACSRRRRLWW